MSDAPQSISLDEATDAWVKDFTDALESRFPSPSSSAETEPAAPGDDEPGEGPEPSSPETPPVPAEEPVETPPAETEPDEGAPAEGEPPDSGAAQPEPAFTLAGTEYTAEQLGQMVPVYDWFAKLRPEEVQAIDGLLSGQYVLAPAQPQTPSESVGPQGQSPSSPGPAADDEGDWLDPRAQQEIRALRQQINELQQTFTSSMTPVVNQQQQADYNARLTAINTAHDTFKTRYDLSDEQMQTLETTIAEAQVLPGLANRHGSLEAGMNAALEMTFWSTPAYRERYEQQRGTSQQAEQQVEEAATVRKQHLTALSGSGGSVPRREPVPTTPEDRHAAMVNEIAAAIGGNGQVQ